MHPPKPIFIKSPKTVPLTQSSPMISKRVDTDSVFISFNHFHGSVEMIDGEPYTKYADLNAYSWFLGLQELPLCEIDEPVNGVGIIVRDRRGTPRRVTDRIFPGAGVSDLLTAEWVLTPSGCDNIGGCGSAKITTSRPLHVPERGTVDIMLDIGGDFTPRRVIKVYRGRCIVPGVDTVMDIDGRIVEALEYHMEGWKAYAEDRRVYGVEVLEGDVADQVHYLLHGWEGGLAVDTPIVYNPEYVFDTGVFAPTRRFDGMSFREIFDELAALCGSVWGVDVNGYFFFHSRIEEPQGHYWLGRNPVRMHKPQENQRDVVTSVIVEAANTGPSGEPIRVRVSDADAGAVWGITERPLNYPYHVAETVRYTGEFLSAMPAWLADPLRVHIQSVGDHWVRYDFGQPVDLNGVTFRQGHTSGTPLVFGMSATIVGVYAGMEMNLITIKKIRRSGELITFLPINTQYITIMSHGEFVESTDTMPITYNNRWIVDETLPGLYGGEIEMRLWGERYLETWSKPTLNSVFDFPPNRFVNPWHNLRITPSYGETRIWEVDHVKYVIDRGLTASADIGQGAFALARWLAFESQMKDLNDRRAKVAEQDLRWRIDN